MAAVERYGTPSPVQRAGNDSVYGSGALGDVTLSAGTTVLSQDMYYNNLTVPSGCFLNTNGFRVFVKNTLTLNGWIGVGALSGGGIIEPSSPVSTGTVAGTTVSNAITYRLGGKSGGATADGTSLLPTGILYSLDVATKGLFIDPNDNQPKSLIGGAAGTTGSQGTTFPALTNNNSWTGKAAPTTWPSKSGNAGSAGNAGNPGQPGQPGNPGGLGGHPPHAHTVGVPGGRGNAGNAGTAGNAGNPIQGTHRGDSSL